MSHSSPSHISQLFNKKVMFLDVETIGLPSKIGDANTKPEEQYYNYKENDKYNNSRIIQFSYWYSNNYTIPTNLQVDDISNFVIKPKDFKLAGLEFHGITNEIIKEKGVLLSKAFKEFATLLLQDEIDYIVGYNVCFDISIILNELHRLDYQNSIVKLKQLFKNQRIIDIAHICNKLKLTNFTQPYRIAKQSEIYALLFKKNQLNSHNSRHDVLNLISITQGLYPLIQKDEDNTT